MRLKTLYFPLLFLFFLILTSFAAKPVLAQQNYVDVNLNVLPIAESKDYFIFCVKTGGSGTIDYWRIYVFSKTQKAIIREYDFSTDTIQTTSIAYAFTAHFLSSTRVLVLLCLYKGYQSTPSLSLYLFARIYDIATNNIIASAGNTRSISIGNNLYASTAKLAHISQVTSYGTTEHWVFYGGGGYESYGGYRSNAASIAKITVSTNLDSVSITRYDYSLHLGSGSVADEVILRRGEIHIIDDAYLLLVAHEPNAITKNIRYTLVARSNGAMTNIATHPFSDDFVFRSSVRNSALYVTYIDTYILINYYATKTLSDGGIKVVYEKLVFNNTLTNLINQYRTADTFYGTITTSIWHIFVPLSKYHVRVIIPNVVGGQNIITMFKISLYNVDTIDNAIYTNTTTIHNPSGWQLFNYISPAAPTIKIKFDDSWVAQLSPCRLYFGLPVFYQNVNAAMLEQTYNWWIKDTIAKNIIYPVCIKVFSNGLNVPNALVEVYDNRTGALQKIAHAYTSPNGIATLTLVYDINLEVEYITIQISVSYGDDVIAIYTKTFKIGIAKYNILLAIVEAKKYDPAKTDYNFSEPIPNVLTKNVNYIFVYRVMKEDIEPAEVSLMFYLWFDNQQNIVTGQTSAGFYKLKVITGANILKIKVEAYYEKVKVAEREDTFIMTSADAAEEKITLPETSIFIFANLTNLLPPLLIILVPTFAFYTVIADYRGLLIGLNVGIVIASSVGLIPLHLLLLLVLVDALAFIKTIRGADA